MAAGAAVLAALPAALGALPARETPVGAGALLARMAGSQGVRYSGYAEAVGGLRLPLTSSFSSLTDLLGDRSRLRVWWGGADAWRIDSIDATGETDVHADPLGTWTWDYQSNEATRSADPPVRLPRAADLDPAQLGRRLLSEARPSEVSRLPARRVAGRDAAGLRLVPDDPQSTVDRVDVWADPGSGLPLRVEAYGAGATRPVVRSEFLDVDLAAPDPATIAFQPPPGARLEFPEVPDVAAGIDRFAVIAAPDRLAGYPRRPRVLGTGAVGTYGRGATLLTALPVPFLGSRSLDQQLHDTPGVKDTPYGPQLVVGPLSLLLSSSGNGAGRWLLAGTVTAQTLQRAAAELARQAGEQ